MGNRGRWMAIACLGALLGCSDRTGVILEVTRDPATTDAGTIDKLRFYVGVSSGDDPVQTADFVNGIAADEVSVGGRDLLDEPYRMLLSPREAADMGLTVAVVGMSGGEPVAYGELDQEIHFLDGQVLSFPVMLYGSRSNVVVTTTGCLIVYGEDGGKTVIAPQSDQDCDNDAADVDCDDSDPTVGPSSPELCFNDRDDDCDGTKDEEEDRDGDGVVNCDDCDDADEHRYPGNAEICDGIDNDCNELCDDGEQGGDVDGDGYTVCGTRILEDGSCTGSPSTDLVDCDDTARATHPGADEVCDGADNDCNEVCDDDFDRDGDFYTECGSDVRVCEGTLDQDVDCEPDDEDAFPRNGPELCDGVDNDCDGAYYPDTVPCYATDTTGGSAVCKLGTRTCGDVNGSGWTSGCEAAANSELVPLELCQAYDACDNAPDPYACANGMVTATTYACTIAYPSAAPGTVCRPNGVALPNTLDDLAVECRWLLSAIGVRAAYEATLGPDLADNTVPVRVYDACDAVFSVIKPNHLPRTTESFLAIQLADGDKQQIIRLDLTPQAVAECPVNGLSCTGLVSPQPAGP